MRKNQTLEEVDEGFEKKKELWRSKSSLDENVTMNSKEDRERYLNFKMRLPIDKLD